MYKGGFKRKALSLKLQNVAQVLLRVNVRLAANHNNWNVLHGKNVGLSYSQSTFLTKKGLQYCLF